MPMLIRIAISMILLCSPTVAMSIGWVGNDLYGTPCQGKAQGFGPYDYNKYSHIKYRKAMDPLRNVETHHFTRDVQELDDKHRNNMTSVIDNIDYTLRAFPNHHRALWAMIRLYLKEGRPDRPDSLYPAAECYLRRALAFTPDDPVVSMLFGVYLQRAGYEDQAAHYYKKSLSLDPNSAEAHYDFGLLLVDQKKYKEAMKHARRAYELGYPLQGLRDRLRAAGYDLASPDKAKVDSGGK